jgi:hypothetical protein
MTTRDQQARAAQNLNIMARTCGPKRLALESAAASRTL